MLRSAGGGAGAGSGGQAEVIESLYEETKAAKEALEGDYRKAVQENLALKDSLTTLEKEVVGLRLRAEYAQRKDAGHYACATGGLWCAGTPPYCESYQGGQHAVHCAGRAGARAAASSRQAGRSRALGRGRHGADLVLAQTLDDGRPVTRLPWRCFRSTTCSASSPLPRNR